MAPLKVLTWNVHGNYLYYLAHSHHEFILPVTRDGSAGYGGRGASFAFGDNVVECPVEELPYQRFDCVLFQSPRNYLVDQYEILTPEQRRLPQVYVEHDPPRAHPTDTRHPVDDPNLLLVHVTGFNQLMWDAGRTPTRLIEHGVSIPADVLYSGDLERGVTAINDLGSRGRRLGADIYEAASSSMPIDLVGMNTQSLGGLGEIPPMDLALFMSRYRFYFHPVRYTSLALALCEAMTVGLPPVAVATAGVVDVVENGVTGFASTSPEHLSRYGLALLDDPALARRLGTNAREMALDRFGIQRFVDDWDRVLHEAVGISRGGAPFAVARQ